MEGEDPFHPNQRYLIEILIELNFNGEIEENRMEYCWHLMTNNWTWNCCIELIHSIIEILI